VGDDGGSGEKGGEKDVLEHDESWRVLVQKKRG
jgi:hypothetical protein